VKELIWELPDHSGVEKNYFREKNYFSAKSFWKTPEH
jgi:hypothetical protein